MLEFLINANSTQESNIFLRKLWCELNEIAPMGWNMYPYRDQNHITIGCSGFGEISFDYARKGCIKKLYIDNSNHSAAITQAVQNALHNTLSEYTILLELNTSDKIHLETSTLGKCQLYSKNGTTYLLIGVKVYSPWDAKMYLPNKFLSILSVLYAYTSERFTVERFTIAEHRFNEECTNFSEYTYDWIGLEDRPMSEENAIIIPDECLKLLAYIIDDESYCEDIQFLLNSSNMLFTTKSMMDEIEFPHLCVKADIINSMACSSLEPLSLILDKNTAQCETCGNKIFSISQKIRKMCSRYFDEDLAKYVSNVIYKNRSIFLHNGLPETTQQPNRVFFPQISPATGMIMYPYGRLQYGVFDLSAYLFRNIAHDLFTGNIE